jgi:hypothetical protein
MKITRTSVQLDRMWKRRGLHKVERISKTNGAMRESLYAKMDRRLDRLRTGLKEYTLDVIRLRMPKVRFSVPDCPKQRWV